MQRGVSRVQPSTQNNIFARIWTFLLVCMAKMRKSVRRAVTGRGELERLLVSTPHPEPLHAQFHSYVGRSDVLKPYREAILSGSGDRDERELAEIILRLKAMRPERPLFADRLLPNLLSLLTLCGTRSQIEAAASALAATAYDAEHPTHSAQLDLLWTQVYPHEPLPGLKGDHWGRLGFQGRCPSTDFRGAGLLALRSLIHLAREHPAHVRAIIADTDLPLRGYPLAVAHIQVTMYALELLRRGWLPLHRMARRPASAASAGGVSGAGGRSSFASAGSSDAAPRAGAGGAGAFASRLDFGGAADADSRRLTPGSASSASSSAAIALEDERLGLLLDCAARLLLFLDDVWRDERAATVMDFPRVFAAFKARVEAAVAPPPRGAGGGLPLPRRLAASAQRFTPGPGAAGGGDGAVLTSPLAVLSAGPGAGRDRHHAAGERTSLLRGSGSAGSSADTAGSSASVASYGSASSGSSYGIATGVNPLHAHSR